jgi:hypothetical protein
MKLRWITVTLGLALPAAAVTALGLGCGNTSVPNPFGHDAGADGADGAAEGGGGEGGSADAAPVDPTLGGPCLDDGQCDDGFDCTFDACDQALGRCRFTPDDSKCQNGVYCDGVERCDNKLGCSPGVPVGCDDKTPCTIDRCDEPTQSCQHAPRDADGDGDPDVHCPGGHDCDDTDPTVSSLLPEVCANGKDDNCDGQIDEAGCVSPQHDTCLDPLSISASGSYGMNTTGAKFDYPTSCGLGAMVSARDVVAAILLPAGPPVDVEVTARTLGVQVSTAIAGQCGDPSTEIACGNTFSAAQGGTLAKARGRALGSATQPTAFPVYLATAPGFAAVLDVQISPAVPKAANETCGTALPITPGVPVAAEILDCDKDLASACAATLGELVYTFDLAAPADVDVYASSIDGDGLPMISLRGSGCALPGDELTCQLGAAPHVFRHALAAGTYYVAVSASAPTGVKVTVDLSAPTAPAADETCVGSPVLPHNKTIKVTLSNHQDDISLGCLQGAVDAAYELDLAQASDVLLVERIAAIDQGAVSLATPACTAATALSCSSAGQSPVRGGKRNVPAGTYRVVAESLHGEDVELTAFVRKAVPPTLVPFADGCADAFVIPPEGGFFQGNTANATADFSAGCDQGGVQAGGAPDQLLRLDLATQKRVVLDMQGSGYYTILDVRQGPGCPGTEIPKGCGIGYPPGRSYLDLTLPAGTYFLQVDGYMLDKGPWFLDVRVVDP